MNSKIKNQKQYFLGLDIGGTKTAIVVGDENGTFYERVEFPTRARRQFSEVYQDIEKHLGKVLSQHPRVGAIGVSIGGPLDPKAGIILSPPNLPGWDNIPLKEMLEKTFNLPVFMMHDAKAGALAEWWFGAGEGCSDLVFLTFGTGLGCGVISDGYLLENIPGEVGHWGIGPQDGPRIYGRNNAWEGVSSGAGIKALVLLRYPGLFRKATTAHEVTDAARKGAPEALEILNIASTYLGKGMAMLADLFAPERIILGSLAVRAGDFFLPQAIEVFKQEVHPQLREHTRIVPGTLGEKIGDYAALCAAMYRRNNSDGYPAELGRKK